MDCTFYNSDVILVFKAKRLFKNIFIGYFRRIDIIMILYTFV